MTDIAGVYLITEIQTSSKQVNNIDYILRKMLLIEQLKENDLIVVLGYLNTESLLFSIADPDIMTIGAYENVRIFGAAKFVDEKKEIRGPSPRLYISKLSQLVDYRYLNTISMNFDDDFLDDTPYNAELFKADFNWHFTKPALYKHYFIVLCQQLNELKKIDGIERYSKVCDILETSCANYQHLDSNGVVLGTNDDGSHLPMWLTAAHQFARNMGWKK